MLSSVLKTRVYAPVINMAEQDEEEEKEIHVVNMYDLFKKDQGLFYAEEFRHQLSGVTKTLYVGIDNLDGFSGHFRDMERALGLANPYFEKNGGVPPNIIKLFVELEDVMKVVDKDYKHLPKGICGIKLALKKIKEHLRFFEKYKEQMDLYKERPDVSFLSSLSDLYDRAAEKKKIWERREFYFK